jgi:uncharacterized SAM-binding protein YcdF (DUF218 family)
MRNAILLILAAAAAALAGVMAYRLSADALAMILGVLLGFLALIPALIIAVVALRRSQEQAAPPPPGAHTSQPPVVVVSGGGWPQMLPMGQPAAQPGSFGPQAMLPAPPPSAPRQFRIMGYEATDAVDLQDDEWSTYEYRGERR